MEAPERGALTLVRLIGAMLVLATILELGLYLAKCYNPRQPAPLRLAPVVLDAIPAVVGAVVLVKSRAIAQWVSDLLDP
jgi:hypothetical protein